MQWWINGTLVPCHPSSVATCLDNYALGIEGGLIRAVQPMRGWQASVTDEVIDVDGGLITPGLIDCHTHLVFGGHRACEFEQRLEGASYEEIALAGGGILSTVKATRQASEEALFESSSKRLRALMREGVTTVEIKSGYGLNLESELKMLRVAKSLETSLPVRVKTTLLAAHALPEEFQGNPDGYIGWVCDEAIPAVAAEQLADAVDIFCEGIGFNLEHCQQVFSAAQEAGLSVKGHMEQLSNIGGSRLAAQFGALSVDHLEYMDEAGVAAIAEAGTVATLLPGAFYFLKEQKLPPIELFRQYQVPMAIATDLNPGSSPLSSLRLMMNMGSTLFGLTPNESLAGATCHAAQALGEQKRIGRLEEGYLADFVVWDLQSPLQLSYQFGTQDVTQRVFAGEVSHV